jgi:hypothetical protein
MPILVSVVVWMPSERPFRHVPYWFIATMFVFAALVLIRCILGSWEEWILLANSKMPYRACNFIAGRLLKTQQIHCDAEFANSFELTSY